MMPFSINKILKKYLPFFLSFAVIILVWFVAAKLVNSSLILPFPKEVFLLMIKLLSTASFWRNFLFTFLRILAAFFLTLIFGVLLGILSAEFKFIEDFLKLPLAMVRATPVVALILIMIFWFPSNIIPIVICLLMTLPIMITAVKTGILNTKPEMIFFAKSRNFNRFMTLRFVKLPNARINFLEGALQCFSLSWKVVIAGEVLCLPRNAIGSRIHFSQIHLETGDVIANTILLVIISFIMEVALKKVVKTLELKIKNN